MKIDVRLLYISRYNFIDEKTGESLKGCKVTYSTKEPIKDDDRYGYKINTCNLSYEKYNELEKLDFPCDVELELELVDMDRKPKVKDIIY